MTDLPPAIGDRVVVRYLLGAGAPADWRSAPNPPTPGGPSSSDITGILREATAETLVIERDGERLRVSRDAVTSIRLLSRRVVRNSQIREVEAALMAAAPADDRVEIDGWMVNALVSGTPQLRSTLAAPVAFGTTAAGLPAAAEWLREHGHAPRVMAAERLLRVTALGAPIRQAEAFEVLVGPIPDGATPDGATPPGSIPDGEWAPIADGVAAATVSADAPAVRSSWRALGFELHHTCRLLTL